MLCEPNMSPQICCIKEYLDGHSKMLECMHETPVILLMDNDSENFEAFQRENVVVRYFTPNLTSCKQPYDLGVIAAVKK